MLAVGHRADLKFGIRNSFRRPCKVKGAKSKVRLEVFDFAEEAGGDVVNETANGNGLGYPGMSAEFLELVADIFVDVLESVEKSGGDGGGAGAILDAGAQVLLTGVHEAAVGVIDDHEFLGAEEMVGDEKGTERIVSDDASSIADDVRIAGFETEGTNGEARIHASKDGELALGTGSEAAEFVSARIEFVGNEDFVNNGHGGEQFSVERREGLNIRTLAGRRCPTGRLCTCGPFPLGEEGMLGGGCDKGVSWAEAAGDPRTRQARMGDETGSEGVKHADDELRRNPTKST